MLYRSLTVAGSLFTQVQDVRFRIPQFILARHSAYFSHVFSNRGFKGDLHIKESDVTSAAFENVLMLLHPLYVPLSCRLCSGYYLIDHEIVITDKFQSLVLRNGWKFSFSPTNGI
jgi:hypothetical protein